MDFVAIQSIRTFTPKIYNAVAENKHLFVQSEKDAEEMMTWPKDTIEGAFSKQAAELCKTVFRPLPKGGGKIAGDVLAGIFPFWNSHFRMPKSEYPLSEKGVLNIIPESASIEPGGNPRQGNLVRHPDIFDRYFFLSLSLGDFSTSDMRRRIAMAENPEAFANMLIALAQEQMFGATFSRLRVFLNRISESHHDDDVLNRAGGILRAFLMVGDKVNDGWNVQEMEKIAYAILRKVGDKEKCFEIFRTPLKRETRLF